MREWVATAQRLRRVKDAYEEYLMRWALDCLIHEQDVHRKVEADVTSPHQSAKRGPDDAQGGLTPEIYRPQECDWSGLYRGSVLDD